MTRPSASGNPALHKRKSPKAYKLLSWDGKVGLKGTCNAAQPVIPVLDQKPAESESKDKLPVESESKDKLPVESESKDKLPPSQEPLLHPVARGDDGSQPATNKIVISEGVSVRMYRIAELFTVRSRRALRIPIRVKNPHKVRQLMLRIYARDNDRIEHDKAVHDEKLIYQEVLDQGAFNALAPFEPDQLAQATLEERIAGGAARAAELKWDRELPPDHASDLGGPHRVEVWVSRKAHAFDANKTDYDLPALRKYKYIVSNEDIPRADELEKKYRRISGKKADKSSPEDPWEKHIAATREAVALPEYVQDEKFQKRHVAVRDTWIDYNDTLAAAKASIPEERVIRFDGSLPRSTSFWFASNEWDYLPLKPLEQEVETDVVYSFSNNVGWDLAVRLNAKKLVLVDYQATPMQAQELLIRPLILTSSCRADFLARVAGTPVAGIDKETTAPAFFKLLKAAKPTWYDVRRFHRQILADIAALVSGDSELKKIHLEHVQCYLAAIRDRMDLGPDGSDPFRPGAFADNKTALLAKTRYPFFLHVTMPVFIGANKRLIALKVPPDDASRAAVRSLHEEILEMLEGRYASRSQKYIEVNPYHCCMSSPAAFERLKALFVKEVFYCVVDVKDKNSYRKLRKKFGDVRYTLSFSNVPDFVSVESSVFIKDALEYLPCSAEKPLQIFETRGKQEPHAFEHRCVIDAAAKLPDPVRAKRDPEKY